MSEWIKCSDRLPKEDFCDLNLRCAVVCYTAATEAKGFFAGIPESRKVIFAIWSCREELSYYERNAHHTTYRHKWGWVSCDVFHKSEELLKNVIYWMPLPKPPGD